MHPAVAITRRLSKGRRCGGLTDSNEVQWRKIASQLNSDVNLDGIEKLRADHQRLSELTRLDETEPIEPQMRVGGDTDSGAHRRQQKGELCAVTVQDGSEVLARLTVDRDRELAEHPYVGMNQALNRLPMIVAASDLAVALGKYLSRRGENSDQVMKKRLMQLRHGL